MKHSALPGRQRGAAALIVTLLMFLALALLAFGMKRLLLIEQRSATNHARAAQAFETAEAGLAWAQGALNDMRPIGPDCRPAADAAATAFRTQYLRFDRASGVISATSGQPACVRNARGWSCRCQGQTTPTPDAEGGVTPPSFALTFQTGPRAGTIRVAAASNAAPDATARLEAILGLYAGLRATPGHAITTRDMTPYPTDRFFAAWFGVDKATWRDQPAVGRMSCAGECGRDVAAAVSSGHELLWIDGDATLAGPLALGSPERPIVLVATGSLRLDSGMALHGVIYAGSVMIAGTDNAVHGAVLSESLYAGPAGPTVMLDMDVLGALARQTGSFVRMPGSWRDF